jgi:hypothetical protein
MAGGPRAVGEPGGPGWPPRAGSVTIGPVPPDHPDEQLAAEACRLHARYTEEVIERFHLCPWARGARLAGQVERVALLQADLDPGPTLALIARLCAATPPPPMVIAIYPRMAADPRQFDAFASEVKALDQARGRGRPAYVSATFHPDYPFDDRSGASLVPWLRRSPDPSLQLVRSEVVEDARGPAGKILFDFTPAAWADLLHRVERGTLPERIAADNRATALAERQAIEQVIADIAADRARSYGAGAALR